MIKTLASMKTNSTDYSPLHPIEASFHQLMEKTEQFVRREPVKAVAVAFGTGVILKVLPPRAIAKPLVMLTAKLLPPALIGLGLIKALELARSGGCCQPAGASETDSH